MGTFVGVGRLCEWKRLKVYSHYAKLLRGSSFSFSFEYRRLIQGTLVRRQEYMPIEIIFLFCATFSFLSAFFPNWDIRWGVHRGSFNDKVPVSVQGRIAFGFLFAYFSGATILGDHGPFLWPFLMVVAVLLLIGMRFMYSQDRRSCPPPEVLTESFGRIISACFILVACVAWSLSLFYFIAFWINRGWFRLGRGTDGSIIRRADNPVGFWTGIAVALAISAIASGLGLYNLLRQTRRSRRPW
jgi:hypothetical protein